MPIKVQCRACQKHLRVPDKFAGKRLQCPNPECQQPVAIPSPQRARQKVTQEQRALAEEMALQALVGEEHQEQEQEPESIKFECEYCEEEIEVSASEEGTRMQCPNPECRQLIRVPKVEKKDEKKPGDWKAPNAGKLRAEALLKDKQDDFEVDDNVTRKTTVSQAALQEADAIPEKVEVEPVSPTVWIQRILMGLVAAAVMTGLFYGALNLQRKTNQKQAIKLVESNFEAAKEQMPPSWEAAFHKGMGEYYRHKSLPQLAKKRFQKAIFLINKGSSKGAQNAPEQLFLLEVAKAQVPLGGTDEEVQDKTRLPWGEVQTQLRRTLDAIRSIEGKLMALRRLNQFLLSEGQMDLAIGITNEMASRSARGADKKTVTLRAEHVRLLHELTHKANESGNEEQGKKYLAAIDKIARLPKNKVTPINFLVRYGFAAGKASQGQFEDSYEIIQRNGPFLDRLRTALAVAEIALSQENSEAARTSLRLAEKQVPQLKRATTSIWPALLYQRSEAYAKLGDEKLLRLASKPLDDDTKAFVQLMANGEDLSPDQITPESSLAFALANFRHARYQTRLGGRSTIESQLEKAKVEVRPLLAVGVLLGSQ
ncbi:MAG: hypothetical protein ACFCD0_23010 [Gemmataceae bacterium]